jgi:diaminopimelate decarboxylase
MSDPDALPQHFGDLAALAAAYDTPLVVYSQALLLENGRRLRSVLPPRAEVAYSAKANPNPAIVRLFSGEGLLVEVASAGELASALRAGVAPSKLLLGGPAKRREAIDLAIAAGVPTLLVESLNDLARVREAAQAAGAVVEVALRVNPGSLPSQSVLRMGGLASPFGIDEQQIPHVVRACGVDGLRFAGLFLYAGSQHFDAQDIVENTRYLCRLARRLAREGLPAPSFLDFGGGFGVPEDAAQPELDLGQLRTGLEQVFVEDMAELIQGGLRRAVFESGRFLVNSAGIYLTRVLDLKQSHGRQFAILDGGINNLGVRQLPYRTFEPPIQVWGKEPGPPGEQTALVGPTCTPVDVVHKGCCLPRLEPGDLVLIRNFGAYALSYSPIHFCGHPWPAEVLVACDGTRSLVRRRGRLEEACGLGYTRRDVEERHNA